MQKHFPNQVRARSAQQSLPPRLLRRGAAMVILKLNWVLWWVFFFVTFNLFERNYVIFILVEENCDQSCDNDIGDNITCFGKKTRIIRWRINFPQATNRYIPVDRRGDQFGSMRSLIYLSYSLVVVMSMWLHIFYLFSAGHVRMKESVLEEEREKRVHCSECVDKHEASIASIPSATPHHRLLYPTDLLFRLHQSNIFAVAFKGSSLQQCPCYCREPPSCIAVWLHWECCRQSQSQSQKIQEAWVLPKRACRFCCLAFWVCGLSPTASKAGTRNEIRFKEELASAYSVFWQFQSTSVTWSYAFFLSLLVDPNARLWWRKSTMIWWTNWVTLSNKILTTRNG